MRFSQNSFLGGLILLQIVGDIIVPKWEDPFENNFFLNHSGILGHEQIFLKYCPNARNLGVKLPPVPHTTKNENRQNQKTAV